MEGLTSVIPHGANAKTYNAGKREEEGNVSEAKTPRHIINLATGSHLRNVTGLPPKRIY